MTDQPSPDRELGRIVDGYEVNPVPSNPITWRIWSADGPLTEPCTIKAAWELCDYLRAAHRRGVEEGVECAAKRIDAYVEWLRKGQRDGASEAEALAGLVRRDSKPPTPEATR